MRKSQSEGPAVPIAPRRLLFEATPEGWIVCGMEDGPFLINWDDLARLMDPGSRTAQVEPPRWNPVMGVETFAQIQRLLKKGLNQAQIARYIGFPENEVRAFYAHHIAGRGWDKNTVDEISKAAGWDEVDGCLTVSKNARIFLHLADVKNALARNFNLAETWRLDEDDFQRFLKENKDFLALIK